MEEGYHFLDEKRLILAATMLGELQRYEAALSEFRSDYAAAVESLKAALARHGLEELQAQPTEGPWRGALSVHGRSVLGVLVNEVDCRTTGEGGETPLPTGSPEAKSCRERFAGLLPLAARLAAMTGQPRAAQLRVRQDLPSRPRPRGCPAPGAGAGAADHRHGAREQEREEAIRSGAPVSRSDPAVALSHRFHARRYSSARI